MTMRKPRKIKFIHTEAGKPVTPEIKSEIEELFVDIVFDAWLKERTSAAPDKMANLSKRSALWKKEH